MLRPTNIQRNSNETTVTSTLYPSNWPKSECWLVASLGKWKKGEPSYPAGGKECGWCSHPGGLSGNVLEIGTRWPHHPAVPLQRNSNTHRLQHVLYKDTWIAFIVGARDRAWRGANKAREEACKARSEEYDSLNPLYLRERNYAKKDSIHTINQTVK